MSAPIIVTSFMSLDGVVEDPGGGDYRNAGWSFQAVEYLEAAYEIKDAEQQQAAAMLLGRNTYELFAPVWPGMSDFDRYNSLPKYVVSTTLTETSDSWPATIVRCLDEVAHLKKTIAGGSIIVHGSTTLVAALAEANLVDRYHLLLFPLLLGSGKRLFPATPHDTVNLELVEQARYDNGIIKLVYDVVR